MIHPSYKELMNAVNAGSKDGEPIIHSRYSIVMGTAKRARQLVAADVDEYNGEKQKALSIAVAELEKGEIHIVSEGSGEADIEARMPSMHIYELHTEDEDADGEEEDGEDSYDEDSYDDDDDDDDDDDKDDESEQDD